MNLFFLDRNPVLNAQYHVDKHMKMILESAQLLCTTFHTQNIEAPYRKTHENHPTSIWVRTSKYNFDWTVNYSIKLIEENFHRYGKLHKSMEVIKWVLENSKKLEFTNNEETQFALAMPDEYKCGDPVESYRNYYRNSKIHLFKWSNRKPPPWL